MCAYAMEGHICTCGDTAINQQLIKSTIQKKKVEETTDK